jgi:hypothetical protein
LPAILVGIVFTVFWIVGIRWRRLRFLGIHGRRGA